MNDTGVTCNQRDGLTMRTVMLDSESFDRLEESTRAFNEKFAICTKDNGDSEVRVGRDWWGRWAILVQHRCMDGTFCCHSFCCRHSPGYSPATAIFTNAELGGPITEETIYERLGMRSIFAFPRSYYNEFFPLLYRSAGRSNWCVFLHESHAPLGVFMCS